MPIKKNAIKYMRVTARKTETNKIAKGVLKSAIKKTREAVTAGRLDDAQKFYKEAQKALDKAAERISSRRIPQPTKIASTPS
jgi:small subunit ribosomal protein S20